MKASNAWMLSVLASLVTALVLTIPSSSVHAASPKVTTVPVPSGGQAVVARVDGKGTIHLVFDSPDGPQYVSSRDNGKTLSEPIPLVDQASRRPAELEFVAWDMAVTSDGAVHVAISTNAWQLKLPEEEWGYFYTRRLADEKAFAPLRNINRRPSEGFSLAVDEQGTVAAVWMADKLFVNLSHDGGDTFAPTVEIDASLDPCNCCTTSSVFAADGRLAILYREETNNDRDMYLALWDHEAGSVTKHRVGTTPWKVDACPMTYYSVTRDGDGFIAAWPTKGQIYFARLDADGAPQGRGEIKTPGVCGMRTGVLALATSDGNSLVAWKKDKQLGWQLYDPRGRPLGAAGSVKSAGNGAAGVLAKNGQYVLFR